jgi:hypothetical protein
MFAHLGAGVPYVREVAGGEGCVAGSGSGHPAMIAVSAIGLKHG